MGALRFPVAVWGGWPDYLRRSTAFSLPSVSAQALATAESGSVLPGIVAQPPFSMNLLWSNAWHRWRRCQIGGGHERGGRGRAKGDYPGLDCPLYVAEFQFRYNNRFNDDIFGTAIEGC
jgi:hypothetical protein